MKAANPSLKVIEIRIKTSRFKSAIASVFQKAWMTSVRYFTRNSEPQIWQEIRSDRTPIWHIYDPQCDRTFCFTSESEVRVWIEQRYSQ